MPVQATFFFICMCDSVSAGYHPRVVLRPGYIYEQYPHKSWERFVNDLYPIIKQIYEENFFQHISNLYCNLKFTMKEESSGELAFFDTLLNRENGNYTVFVYRNQPKINYPNCNSHCQTSCKKSIIFSLVKFSIVIVKEIVGYCLQICF